MYLLLNEKIFFLNAAPLSTLSPEDKIWKEELEARVEVLQNADKKIVDLGPTYDCVLFHDGTVWR